MEIKWVGLVELVESEKASSLSRQLQWKKLNSGMKKNIMCQLLSEYEDFKEL